MAMLEEDAHGTSLLDGGLANAAHEVLETGAPPLPCFGPYRTLRPLGEGGMGVVYLAERDDLQHRVAIKVLRDAWLSPARRERFAAEQQTLAQLNHPSIARLYDADTLEDGTPWFVMEYIDGLPLVAHCHRHSCSIDERLKLFRAVCEAVQHAHLHAIIHRDLKPSNILVTRDGQVKLLDFGIAKQLDALDGVDQTRTALRIMTPAYAAPEQIRGERVGIYTDVYALGVILYELLAGRLPFDLSNRTPGEAETIIVQQDPEKPSIACKGSQETIGPAAWSDLDVLCLTAMHKDPARRYRSVDALIREIDHYLNSEPLDARPDTVRYRVGKFIRRHHRAVASAALVFAIVTGLVIFYTARLRSARNAAQAERDRANRQAAITTAVNQFLADDLLGRSNPFQSGKSGTTLVDAVKQASPDIDRKFADAPQVAARLHLAIARALDLRSEFPDARAEYDRASALFVRAGGPLSGEAIATQLQRAAMEARTYEAGSLERARSILAEQESRIANHAELPGDVPVWLASARGMVALIGNDAKSAAEQFQIAYDRSLALPEFDETARLTLKQRLAFAYIRLGQGKQAERLFRELIAAFGRLQGVDSPSVLRVRLNLAQAFMIQNKHKEAIEETKRIYPAYIERLGEDHELAMQVLATQAQSEGSLELWNDAIRDDLKIHELAVRKQGPLSFYAIATLADTALAQCRAGRYQAGELNARRAFDASAKAFGARAGLTGGAAQTLAACLVELNKLDEASRLLQGIDTKAVAQLVGSPDWSANLDLTQAEIAYRRGDYATARKYLDSAAPVLSRADAEPYQRHAVETLMAALDRDRRK